MSNHNSSEPQGASHGNSSVAPQPSNPKPPASVGTDSASRFFRFRIAAGRAFDHSKFVENFIRELADVVDDQKWEAALRQASSTVKKRAGRGSIIALFALITFLCIGPSRAHAEADLPNAPEAKPRIFDLETVTELELVGGSLAADAMSTQKIYEFPNAFQEPNPLARPFVRSRAGDVAWFGGAFALDVYGTYLLRKHNHPWIARTMNLAIVGWEARLATANYLRVNNSNEECGLHHPVTGCVGGRPQ